MNISLDAVVSLIGLASFGLLILPTALRWRMNEKAILSLSLYLALGLIWNIGVAVIILDIVSDPAQQMFFEGLAAISRSAMPLVFGALTLAFLGHTRTLYWYWGFGLLVLGAWVAISFNLSGAADYVLGYLPAAQTVTTLLNLIEITIWSVATVVALAALYASFRRHPQAQYRNRFRYWFGGTLVLSAANIIILLPNPNVLWVGSALNIAGALLITYIVMRYHPPDLKIIVNRIVQSITVTLTLSLILFAALNSAYQMNRWQTDSQTILFWLVVISLAMGFILPQLSRWIQRTLSRVLFGGGFDEASTLSAYSQTVLSDWDFTKLSKQALNFILQNIGLDRGVLFVDEGDGSGNVTLKPVTAIRLPGVETGYFASSDPFIISLRQNQTAITQYDLDVLPEYRTMDPDCKGWLAAMDIDLFFPLILRRREMIGLLALGPKPNHHPYLSQDLDRLHVLAPQIALDLDKAKLFGQLGAVNQKLGEMSGKFNTFDKGKTDFLSIASHELRTPLTQIHGYASMLLEASEEDLQSPAYLQLVFSGIAKGSTRLKDVVDLIFDVSKAEIGELEVARDPISLADVVDQAVQKQDAALNERGHDLVISGLEQLPTVEGDMARLAQAVTHLLNNAIKYTPDGGTITITGRTTIEDETVTGVELIFTDTGIGINPQDHSQIFEKFYRVGNVENHSTSSVKFKGAGPGLGLPLVAGIARAHGGDVWVESPEYNEETCPG
ncbi:MAG: ATP-binding protein, partial [Anaerolineae bacterium]